MELVQTVVTAEMVLARASQVVQSREVAAVLAIVIMLVVRLAVGQAVAEMLPQTLLVLTEQPILVLEAAAVHTLTVVVHQLVLKVVEMVALAS
tara:strand:- start:136 stop:414 length:279 start_codon:yes stop_codon:yes gene_type:complete